MLQTKRRR